VFQAAKQDGCTDEAAMQLTLQPSVYGHLVFGLIALSLDSLAPDERATGESTEDGKDLSDLDYLCVALFCGDLATNRDRLRRIYPRLISALQVRNEIIRSSVHAEEEKPVPSGMRLDRRRMSHLSERMRVPRMQVSLAR